MFDIPPVCALGAAPADIEDVWDDDGWFVKEESAVERIRREYGTPGDSMPKDEEEEGGGSPHCRTARLLLEELGKGASSFYSPHLELLSDPLLAWGGRPLPSAWFEEGRVHLTQMLQRQKPQN
uniref:Uncharacterized protein n=1 Tax=Corethron hystrix TaxID=216773 RepID=A0A7S1BHR3_9STRA